MNDSRRILIIPSWYPPDGGQFFQDHAEALADRGYQVDVLVNRIVGLSRIRLAHRHTFRHFSVSSLNKTRIIRAWYLKLPWMEMWNMKRWSRNTIRLFRKYRSRFGRPDLLLAHSSIWAGYAAALLSEETGIPLLLVEHRSRFTMTGEDAAAYLKPAFAPYIRRAFGQACRVITVSDALQPMVLRYMEEREKLITLPNLVDTSFFRPPAQEPASGIRILSIGRLDREKGMDLLIRAFGQFALQHKEATLRIAGAGKELPHLQSLAAGSGVSDRIVFLGRLDPGRLLEELQQATLFALASRFEAFGVTFIEAMAVGLPILATRAGGPQTFIPDFAGEVVETGNVDALHNALLRISSSLNNYDRERIRRYVMDHFSREAVATRYETLINELLHD